MMFFSPAHIGLGRWRGRARVSRRRHCRWVASRVLGHVLDGALEAGEELLSRVCDLGGEVLHPAGEGAVAGAEAKGGAEVAGEVTTLFSITYIRGDVCPGGP